MEIQKPTLNKVQTLILDLRHCIIKSLPLPLFTIKNKFNWLTLSFEIETKQPLILKIKSLNSVARIVQLLVEIQQLIRTQNISTKRAIYYKYLNIYKDKYQCLYHDLRLICASLSVKRIDLNIVGSSKCIVNGHARLKIGYQQVQISRNNNFYIPNTKSISIINLFSKIVIVVEKQSAFNYLVSNSHNPRYLFVTSKGYPDHTTQQFLLVLSKVSDKFYYLGDLDPYGFDIMLKYSLGDFIQGFGLIELQWLDLEKLLDVPFVNQKVLQQQQFNFSQQDDSKINYILGDQLFGSLPLGQFLENTPNYKSLLKFQRWKLRIMKYRESGKKIQIQAFFKSIQYPTDLSDFMILNNMIV